MKRLMIILFAIGMTTMSSTSMAAMSKSKVRKEARFLTDKMAYELNLSVGQRNDTYEINYDFIYSVRDLMDDVLSGEEWAMERYYYLLDIRNDDLRWVLSDSQYRKFIGVDYFYRPIYASGNKWSFRIYFTYTNHSHFFFPKPSHYVSYHCDHYRRHYDNVSYYRNRYNHKVYVNVHSVRDRRVYNTHRTSDFSTVRIRPNTSKPSESVNTNRRPSAPRVSTGSSSSVNTNSSRRNNSSTTVRPSTSTGRTNSVSSGTSTTTNRRPVNTNSTTTKPSTTTSTSTSSGSSNRGSVRTNSSSSSKSSSSTSRPSSSYNSSSSSSSKSSGSSVRSSSSSSKRTNSSSSVNRGSSSSNSSKSSVSSPSKSSSSSSSSSARSSSSKSSNSSKSSVSSPSRSSSSSSSSVRSNSSGSSNTRSSSSSGSSSRSSSSSSSGSSRSSSRR